MIIPIGHESQKVNRIPWISFVIISSCFIIHVSTISTLKKLENDLQTQLFNMLQYYFNHSYLEIKSDIKELFAIDEQFDDAVQQRNEQLGLKGEIPTDEVVELEQHELDSLCNKILATLEKIPYKKWGYIPTKKSFLTLFTYMFLHGGWLHLIGNLLLLYLTAPFIEDIWGKPIFLFTYVIIGMLAARMFALHYPNFAGPLIGASGALSGIMGAFMVKFWKTKIKFFFWIFILAGTFKAPAWFMMPLWIFYEFYNARAMDALKIPGGGGVAHWVHVWGFVFGAAVALGLKYSGIEKRYITPKIQARISFKDEKFSIYEEAMEAVDKGKKKEAFDKLLEGAKQHPTDQLIVEALWNLGGELERKAEAVSYYARLLENEFRLKNFELALFHYGQLKEYSPGFPLGDQTKIILIDHLISNGYFKEAENLTGDLLKKLSVSAPAGILLQLCGLAKRPEFANLGRESGRQPAQEIIALALKHPDIPGYRKNELKTAASEIAAREKTLKTIAAAKPAAAEAGEQNTLTVDYHQHSPAESEAGRETGQYGAAAAEPLRNDDSLRPAATRETARTTAAAQPMQQPAAAQKTIHVTSVLPAGFKDTKIILEIENVGRRLLSPDKIQAISVARITPRGEKPFFVIDLLIDDPLTAVQYIRTLRMFTSRIDFLELFPGTKDRVEAFKNFTAALLKLSGAAPYPDLESLQLKKVRVFPGITDYDNSLKNAR